MMELSEKVMLDIGVSEGFVETVVQAIMYSPGIGEVGDRKIFVYPVDQIYRIRTGDRDTAVVTPVGAGGDRGAGTLRRGVARGP